MVTIKIDPVTRLEGHLSVTVEVEDNVVKEAHSEATTFRGFEVILVGRDPRDAPVLSQRICGVCHEVHRITGLRALEDAAGVKVPEGARILRNMIEAITTIYSHALHIYVLCGPDYSDAITGNGLTRLNPITGEAYIEAYKMQRKLHEALAILGGKVPHNMTPVAGGATFVPTVNQALRVVMLGEEVSDWVGPTENLPAVLERKLAGEPKDMTLGHVLNDVIDIAAYALLEGKANEWGVSHGNFISFGVYDEADGSQLEPSGVYDGTKMIPMDEKKVTEDVKYSWYTDASGGVPTRDAPPPTPAYGKEGAYSWAKAPRYDGMPVESGPLARLIAAGLDPFDLRKDLGGGANKSSTLNRILARAQETLFLRDWVLGVGLFEGNGLKDELLAALKAGNVKTYTPFEVPDSGLGVGLWEAPRGATGHWTYIKNKLINRYQVIAGTTWNTTPRDNNGKRGPIEEALIGVPVPDDKDPINVLRTIRSFDPCLACTVHMIMPGGKKYKIDVNTATP